MVALRFDVRDLFRAPRIAFSFQRLWIQFLGLLAAQGPGTRIARPYCISIQYCIH